MQARARELADEVIAARRKAWDKADPATSVVATDELNPEDQAAVVQIVESNGYTGHERDEMIRKVASLIVGRVEALADHMPADNGD